MSEINRERLIEHFFQLIKIDSESRNEKQIAETLAEQLGAMGLTVHKLPVPRQVSNGFNVYARLEGSLDGSIVLSATFRPIGHAPQTAAHCRQRNEARNWWRGYF